MPCRHCGHVNREDARFCGGCGANLADGVTCGSCGARNPSINRFCEQCGTPTAARAPAPPDHLGEKVRVGGRSLEGERKQVTVLFADVMGSMDLAEQVDAEEWQSIMERFFGILSEGVHRFEGTVDKFTGDGIMALFGAPIAHEDHALRAGYAALHLHATLAEYTAELRRTTGLSFSVRIGLNSGEVVVGQIGDDLKLEYTAVGHTVGLAQRMESLAEPGTTYLTQATGDLMASYVQTEDLGEFDVKGASEPVHVYRLTGAGTARSRLDLSAQRGFSRFVGRGDELDVLETALARSLNGQPQVIGVVGEAGVGKSRLCHELAEIARARELPVYHAVASSHGRTLPFSAALDLIRTYFRVDDHMDEQSVRERVAGRLLLLDPAFSEDLGVVFEFLGVPDPSQSAPRMDPEARQRRLLSVVGRLVQAQSHREPGLTLIEDLHWLDPGSELMLEALVDALPGTRTLVVANFRPEYRAEWMRRAHYLQLPLVPLGPEAAEAMLHELLGEHPSLDGLPEEIRRRTGGNPFFIEEVVRGLTEEGVLSGERGAFTLARSVDQVAVPPRVQTVLAGRIDRLSARDKSLLQAASVLGHEFGEHVLTRIAELSEPDLAAGLRALTASDFLHQQALYPEPEYVFRHPLIHEVAYGSQLGQRRERLHAAAAEAIEDVHADSLDERAALLAHHWDAANQPLHAARWSAKAAAWAGPSAPAEALRWWRLVRDRAADLPEDGETRALAILARIWILQLAWRLGTPEDEVEEAYRSGLELAARAGDRASQGFLSVAYGATIAISGRPAEAVPVQREAAEVVRGLGVPAIRLGITLYLSYIEFVAGDVVRSEAICRELIDLADGDGTLGAGLSVGCPLGWVHMMRTQPLVYMGRLAEAEQSWRTGLELALAHDDLETSGWCHLSAVNVAWATGEVAHAAEHGARALEIAEANGSVFSRVWAMSTFGRSQVYAGDPEIGVEYVEAALRLAREQRCALEGEAFQLTVLAEGYLATGSPERALEVAREAVAVARAKRLGAPGDHAGEMLGRVLVAAGPSHYSEAAAVLDETLVRASARGLELVVARIWDTRTALAAARGGAEHPQAVFAEARRRLEAIGATGRLRALEGRAAALAI